MTYVVFDKPRRARQGGRRVGPPKVRLNTQAMIVLNASAYELLGSPDAVLLLFDKDADRIALSPCRSVEQNAFKVHKNRTRSEWAVSARGFCRHHQIDHSRTRWFEPVKENDLIILQPNK